MLLAQSFFVRRAWHRKYFKEDRISVCELMSCYFSVSNKNRILTGSLVILIIVEISAVTIFYDSVQGGLLWSRYETFKVMTIEEIVSALVVFTDIFLASSLVFLLRRRRSGVKRTDSIVRRIIVYIISTSLVTSLVACLGLMTVIAFPRTFLYLCFAHLISQCTCFLPINEQDLLTRIYLGYVNCMFVSYVSHSLTTIATSFH